MTEIIEETAWATTIYKPNNRQIKIIPTDVHDKIREKKKAKAKWRKRENKKHVNKLAKEIKSEIKDHNNNDFSRFIETLSAYENANYSLWKATNKIKKPIKLIPAIKKAGNTWTRSNKEQAAEFSNHLCNTFTPYIINNSRTKCHSDEDAQNISNPTNKHYTIPNTTAQEIKVNLEKPFSKSNAFNHNNIQQYFPNLWKLAQIIIMLPKPGKDPHQTASYRPISLLPVFSKILEKIICDRLKPTMVKAKLIPHHQLGFRNKHKHDRANARARQRNFISNRKETILYSPLHGHRESI